MKLALLALGGLAVAAFFLLTLGFKRSSDGAGPGRSPSSAARPAAGSAQLFSPQSFWNKPLQPDAPLAGDSASLVAGLAASARQEIAQGIGPWISTHECSTPIYVVPREAEKVRVRLTHPHASWRAGLARAFARVPLPASARPARCVDAHLTVWQPATNRLWEFFHLRREDGAWIADWGGAMEHVSKSKGFYSSSSWPGLSAPNWGATATSLPVAGGVMRIAELRRGRIDHALALDVPVAREGEFSWPAQRSDGNGPASALPEGARLRLDPSLNLNAMQMPPLTRTIARAAQRFGIVVRDQTGLGNAIAFFGEDPRPRQPDPYEGADGLFEASTPIDLLAKFPWDRLQLLRMSLCTRAPCRG